MNFHHGVFGPPSMYRTASTIVPPFKLRAAVRAYSAGWLGTGLMFAMEYVDGDDLAALALQRNPDSW